ncbi:GNAT family N-acetyltransferase [Jatrophihabitans telluris]|uniref:GNAT family N-acetyltransferase n=1 Tax=Jatrophihabitans telluris TaxID=2038343 RepID=A0ABY4R3A9_9ACTN|nr:GNAT family N-acetyltransferase [Jatrophihabitans telluris]UQX89514.1 GNAT family N-acetyltransferase [Jatrophihabitans telluris]
MTATRELLWRPLDTDDVQAWAELTNLVATVDDTEEFYEPEDLAEELVVPGFDPALDTIGVWSESTLVAYGQLRVRDGLNEGKAPGYLSGAVHPDHRGQGIASKIFDRLEPRARELAAERHPGADLKLGVGGGLEGDPVRPLLTDRGYEIVRYFMLMRRDLPGPRLPGPSAVPIRAAIDVRRYSEDWAGALRAAHNAAFADHFGSAPQSEAEWADGLALRLFRPELSFLVPGPDGQVLAYVMSYSYRPGELYIGRVGTVRAARGRGYAKACLVAALTAASEAGYTRADLDVDSINPTGAGALYESVGFRPMKTFASFSKEFPALP